MSDNKFIALLICWLAVIAATLVLVLFAPAIGEMNTEAVAGMQASANMSQQPGVVEAVQSMRYWMYGIPAIAGMVFTVVTLRRRNE